VDRRAVRPPPPAAVTGRPSRRAQCPVMPLIVRGDWHRISRVDAVGPSRPAAGGPATPWPVSLKSRLALFAGCTPRPTGLDYPRRRRDVAAVCPAVLIQGSYRLRFSRWIEAGAGPIDGCPGTRGRAARQ
jgi:hypothetical protein